jgi:hypothetical protein
MIFIQGFMKIHQLMSIKLMTIIESEGRHIHSQVFSRVQKNAHSFFGNVKRRKNGFF